MKEKRSFLKLLAALCTKEKCLNRSDNACVPISELPSYIRTMFGLNVGKSIRIDIIQWIIEIKEIEIDRGGGVIVNCTVKCVKTSWTDSVQLSGRLYFQGINCMRSLQVKKLKSKIV